MNTEGYTCFIPQMGTDYRITPYSYITSFVCYHPENSESEATRKFREFRVFCVRLIFPAMQASKSIAICKNMSKFCVIALIYNLRLLRSWGNIK